MTDTHRVCAQAGMDSREVIRLLRAAGSFVVTFTEDVLAQIDQEVKRRQMTRSAFLAAASRESSAR